MVKLYEDTNIKAIANAIRERTGETKTYKVSEMAEAILGIQSSGAEDGMIDGSIVSVDNDRVTFVREEAFYYCESLQSVNLPNVTAIGDSAFVACTALETVNMPKLQTVGYSAFSECEALESIDLPEVTTIDEYAFDTCTNLININIPKVECICSKAFQDCTSLKKYTFLRVAQPLMQVQHTILLFMDCIITISLYIAVHLQNLMDGASIGRGQVQVVQHRTSNGV